MPIVLVAGHSRVAAAAAASRAGLSTVPAVKRDERRYRWVTLAGLVIGLLLSACGTGDSASPASTVTSVAPERAVIEFRPVLGVVPAGTLDGAPETVPLDLPDELEEPFEEPPPGVTAPDLPDVSPSTPPAGTEAFDQMEGGVVVATYYLGPPMADGSVIESAQAVRAPTGAWVVQPIFKAGADGIDHFNALAAECFQRTPACPMGQLAIVVDGDVVSAPSSNEPSFQRDQIQISGNFTEQSARAFAARLAP
jgi:hypothetical protein